MNKYSSSVNREQLRQIKYNTTPEQRMNWLVDAQNFVRETAQSRKTNRIKKKK